MTLVLIDLQPCFDASNLKRIRTTVQREIRLAKSRQQPIILVEFDNGYEYFPTHSWLLESIQHYEHFHHITKKTDNGSAAVIDCIVKNEYSMPVRICGVNWEACVFETVIGLAKHGKIEVIKKGCGSWRHRYNWHLFDDCKNVEVI